MKLRNAAFAVILPVTLLVAACASGPSNRSIPMAARDKIAATDVVLPIYQNEITVAIPVSTGGSAGAASFGLIGALVGSLVDASIDSANAAAAEASVKSLRDAMVDFDFDAMMQAELQTALSQAAYLKHGNVRVVKEVSPDYLEKALKESKASAMLVALMSYQLNFNADELTIVMAPRVLPKTADLQAMLPEKYDPKAQQITANNELYRNAFTFVTAVPNATNNRDANIALWAANGGAPLRDAMKQGAAKLAQMAVADLQAEPPAKPFDPKAAKLKEFQNDLIFGHVLSKDDLGTHVLQATGAQVYVTDVARAALLTPPAAKKK
jgi:hypothetical protein